MLRCYNARGLGARQFQWWWSEIYIFFLDCDFLTTEDSWFVQGVSGRIQRADVARYMLRIAEENLHQKKIVAISPK